LEDVAQLDQVLFVKLPATAYSEQWEQAEEVEQVEENMAMAGVLEAHRLGGEDRYLKDGDKMLYSWYHFGLVGIRY
jgi:hypothetical protein